MATTESPTARAWGVVAIAGVAACLSILLFIWLSGVAALLAIAASLVFVFVFVFSLGIACGMSLRRRGRRRAALFAIVGGGVCAVLLAFAPVAMQAETVTMWDALRPFVIAASLTFALIGIDALLGRQGGQPGA